MLSTKQNAYVSFGLATREVIFIERDQENAFDNILKALYPPDGEIGGIPENHKIKNAYLLFKMLFLVWPNNQQKVVEHFFSGVLKILEIPYEVTENALKEQI